MKDFKTSRDCQKIRRVEVLAKPLSAEIVIARADKDGGYKFYLGGCLDVAFQLQTLREGQGMGDESDQESFQRVWS